MKSLDLLLISNVFEPEVHGGYELLASDCALALVARGHRVTVLTSGARAPRDSERNVRRLLALSRPFGSPAGTDRARHLAASARNAAAMGAVLSRGRPFDGALVFSLRRMGLEPLRALARHHVPTCVTVNDDWPLAYLRTPQPGVASSAVHHLFDSGWHARHTWGDLRCERVLWLSETLRDRVTGSGAPLGRGVVQAQGVDRSLFRPRAFRPVDRKAPKLLFVGRLHPEKGPELVLEAVAALARRGVGATARFVGAPVTEHYGEALRAHARALGVHDRVEWYGAVTRSALPALYAEADMNVFVCRSETEGLGLTWLEAMAVGVPVVAQPSGGARAFFDEHGGVERADHSSIADAVLALLSSPDRQRALVERGLELVREHASLDRYVDALVSTLGLR